MANKLIFICFFDHSMFFSCFYPVPTNIIIENLSGLADVAKLNPVHAFVLIIISVTLTIIGGAIPANMASRKDPVEALRTE